MEPSLLLLMLPESPYPPQCGNALRDVQQITLLRQMGFAVHLLLLQRRSDLTMPEMDFVPAGVEVTYADVPPMLAESTLGMLWRKIGYLFWSKRHAFAWWAAAARPAEFLAAEVASQEPYAVVMRSIFMDCIGSLRRTYAGPIIIDCHDADVHLAAEALRSVPLWRRIGPFANFVAVRRTCRTYLPLANEVWAVSADDARRIGKQGASRVVVVPSGVENADENVAMGSGEKLVAVMVANYDYGPNANGARWLIEKVWPAVLREMPTACLDLVGGGMPAKLEATCRAMPGCTVHGRLADLEPSYRRAAVVVAPILEGAGTRLKIVEAWSRGKAVLTTSKGIEGLGAPSECAVVADNPSQFARSLVELFNGPAKRFRLGKRGHRFVRDHLSYTKTFEIVASRSLLAAVRP